MDNLVTRLRKPWFTNGCAAYQLEAADRIEKLEKALREIVDGRGECGTCGVIAKGEGSGYTACDCKFPTWKERAPGNVARTALEQNP